MGMKKVTLFEHKKVAITTCEKNMGEYQKLLEPPTKKKKASDGSWTYVIYSQCKCF
jgi:hypothetical protein